MKYISVAVFILLVSCTTTKVSVVDGYVTKKEKIIRLTNKPDTVRYITLWSGEVITEKEFDKRWDKAIERATKKIKKELKK